jgi:hypothetical protein
VTWDVVCGYPDHTIKIPDDHTNKWKKWNAHVLCVLVQTFSEKKRTLNIKTKHIKQFHSSKTHLTENSVMIYCIYHTRRGVWRRVLGLLNHQIYFVTKVVTGVRVESSWNMMAHGDAREGKWRGNWRMEWVASTLPTTSEHGVSSITTADVRTLAAGSRLNLCFCWFKWTRLFRQKTKSGFCACAITFQMQSTHMRLLGTELQLLLVECFSAVLAINMSFGCYIRGSFVLLEGLQNEGVIRQSIVRHCQIETVLSFI